MSEQIFTVKGYVFTVYSRLPWCTEKRVCNSCFSLPKGSIIWNQVRFDKIYVNRVSYTSRRVYFDNLPVCVIKASVTQLYFTAPKTYTALFELWCSEWTSFVRFRRYVSSYVVTPVGPLVFYKRALLTTLVRSFFTSVRFLHCWCVLASLLCVHTPRVFALFGNYIYSINIWTDVGFLQCCFQILNMFDFFNLFNTIYCTNIWC